MSSKHKQVYEYRIIDFETAYVAGLEEEDLRDMTQPDLVEIVNTIEAKLYGV